jgi:hypothetical protein
VNVPPLAFPLPVAPALAAAVEVAADPPDAVPLPEVPELHPAAAIEAVAATAHAASHRVFLSFIASGLHH